MPVQQRGAAIASAGTAWSVEGFAGGLRVRLGCDDYALHDVLPKADGVGAAWVVACIRGEDRTTGATVPTWSRGD